MAVVYVPFLQNLFKTDALALGELILSLVLSTVVFWGVEVEKWLIRRNKQE
jgi:Ca2+-transporting ATPase